MRKLVILSIIIIQFVSCVSVKKHNKQIETLHTPQALRADIDKVYNQLKKYHPKLYQYIPKTDLDYKFDSFEFALQDIYSQLQTPTLPKSKFHYKYVKVQFVNRDIKEVFQV